ncbi:exported hypothetical protein [Xenorhabdus bovienii str. oregonense]|uniref:Uncharacterized protein n=2 Tax=Xenorhabdus bovienii TaxID=40576 RepID=A0A077P0I3_XENBV|nr:hypothetical protein [Xenorhabdus bovienii]CDH07992.1 exported hypothetical protein [Xenorhabdus bovienii str. oregonense]
MKKFIWLALLIPILGQAKETEKEFFIEMVNTTCSKHEDPDFCKWQIENLSAISSINTLTYYNCRLENKKNDECSEAIKMYNYIQDQYDKNMTEITKK